MKNKIRKVIGILFLVLAAICLIFALLQLKKYHDGNKEYKAIAADYTTDQKNADADHSDDFYLDWDGLYAQNNDLVGWIRMSPSVNYPIVQAKDNSYYLHRGFNKTYNMNGSIMVNCYNSPDWSDKNTVIYGHNMNNGSMFGNNKKYMDKAYTLQHPCFYIYTKDGEYTYRIFQTMTVPDDTRPFETQFTDDADFGQYLMDIAPHKDYDLGVSVTEKDQIITLSTCTRHGTRRFLIQGKLDSFKDWDGNTVTVDELRKENSPEQPGESLHDPLIH